MNKYAWNDAMILDKIQEVLDIENIDDMDITPENLEKITGMFTIPEAVEKPGLYFSSVSHKILISLSIVLSDIAFALSYC